MHWSAHTPPTIEKSSYTIACHHLHLSRQRLAPPASEGLIDLGDPAVADRLPVPHLIQRHG